MNNFFVRFSSKDQTLFAKRLSFLIRAGVPLLQSFRIIRNQTKSKSKTKIFDAVIKDVENGQYLATSLEKFSGVFGNFAINIIRVGETGGILEQNLAYLAEELKKKHMMKKKIISALVYPAFIMAATLGITVLLIVFVFPKILPIFNSLRFELPLSTKILIAVSGFLISYWYWILLGGLVFLGFFYFLLRKVYRFQYLVHKLMLYMPIFGQLNQAYQMTNFTRTFGLLMRSGVRVVEALKITSETTENLVYREAIAKFTHGVMAGRHVSGELEKFPELFPELVPQMMAIGEKTGNLSDTLMYLAEMYEQEVDDGLKNLSSVLEPVLMVFMGIVVGFIAMSIITPIYNITQNLHV